MKRIKEIYQKCIRFSTQVGEDHVGAYAAQSAFFFMLSMIPIILLLLMLVRYTPVTKADVMTAVIQVFPRSVDSLITSIVNQVYNQSMGVIPVTVIVALWSAGKGVLAVTSGLNCVYECPETRNYVFLRVLSVFGNTLNLFIADHIPFMTSLADWLIQARIFITPSLLVVFSLLIYKFLPNRRDKFRKQIPGAVFTALGWMVISWIFSVYVDVFQGFSSMYGSLTTIVLIMLWMYFCMYSILLGGELNIEMYDKLFTGKRDKKERTEEE